MTYKVLTLKKFIGGELDKSFVDTTRLPSGLYLTDKPYLYSAIDSIEKIEARVREMGSKIGLDVETYIQNLHQCVLTEVELVLV